MQKAEARLVAVATKPHEAPVPASRGFALSAVLLLKQLWKLLEKRDEMALYPEEAAEIFRYQARRDRLLLPHPCEGEASHARTCFFLKKYEGKREIFWVDTEAGEIRRLAFFAKWQGYPEHFDLDIRPETKATAAGQY